MSLALLLLTSNLIFRQFFEKFCLGELGQKLRINLRHDRRECDQVGIDRSAPILVRDNAFEEILGEVRIAARRAQDDGAQRLAKS